MNSLSSCVIFIPKICTVGYSPRRHFKERFFVKRLKVSNNVIRRLPRYLRKLDELTDNGIRRISSFELGQQLGLTPSQIRQDFSCFGEFGQQGYG